MSPASGIWPARPSWLRRIVRDVRYIIGWAYFWTVLLNRRTS